MPNNELYLHNSYSMILWAVNIKGKKLRILVLCLPWDHWLHWSMRVKGIEASNKAQDSCVYEQI